MATNGVPTWLVTGGTGAIGRYVIDELLTRGAARVLIVARDPSRLPEQIARLSQVRVIAGDMEAGSSLLSGVGEISGAILLAAAWGSESGAYAVNSKGTLGLAKSLRERGVRRVVWFGTASLLDESGTPLAEAERIGSAYIASKAECRRRLLELMPTGLTLLHPTVVVGGAADRPMSHAARLIHEVDRRVWLAQWISPDGRFHLVHAADLARMACDALEGEGGLETDEVVAGAPALSARELLDLFLERAGLRRTAAVGLSTRRVELLTRVLRIRLSPWDRYCLTRAYFDYRTASLAVKPGSAARYPDARSIISSVPRRGQT